MCKKIFICIALYFSLLFHATFAETYTKEKVLGEWITGFYDNDKNEIYMSALRDIKRNATYKTTSLVSIDYEGTTYSFYAVSSGKWRLKQDAIYFFNKKIVAPYRIIGEDSNTPTGREIKKMLDVL